MMLRTAMVICVLGWTGGVCSTDTASDIPISHLTRTQGPQDGMGAHHEREISDPAELIDYKGQLLCEEQIYLAAFHPDLVALGRYPYKRVLPENLPFLDDVSSPLTPHVCHDGTLIVLATRQGLCENKGRLEALLLKAPNVELVLNLGITPWDEAFREIYLQAMEIKNTLDRLLRLVWGLSEAPVRPVFLPSKFVEKPDQVFTFEEGDFPGALRKLHLTNASGKQFFYQFRFDKARFESLRLHPLVKEYLPEPEAAQHE